MRAAVVFVEGQRHERLLSLSKSLARGMIAQGHQVDVIDGMRETESKLTIYKYIAIGSEATTFLSGKLPEVLQRFLKNSGAIAGKRSYAFIAKGKPGYRRALLRLMRAMEGEGMYLKNSGVLATEAEAEAVGKRLHLE
jgi:menaquinone-dependent protoporphyrinogen IX oxidase